MSGHFYSPEKSSDPIRSLKAVVVGSAAIWCLAILAAPLLHSPTLYVFFSIICHQIPSRSWHLAGEPLGVCIRCTAISFGFLAGLLLMDRPHVRWFTWALAITAGQWMLAITVLDSESLRVVSGLLLGATAAPIVRAGVQEMITHKPGTAHESM